jgi:tRNA threonylcarbamoyladenosine biosynthesis protein TsaE
VTSSPEETAQIGEKLGRLAGPGTVIALRGPLGAGKTCLTAGIARGLGIQEPVTSPSYPIITEYEGEGGARLPFYHIDAYRLSGDADFENLGAAEFLYGAGVSVIEWSERIPGSIPRGAWVVELEIPRGDGGTAGDGGEKRRIRINGPIDAGFLKGEGLLPAGPGACP